MHLREMGFVGSRADPDFWMKPASKPDGIEYYQYVICYVDDVTVAMENPKESLEITVEKVDSLGGSVSLPLTQNFAFLVKSPIFTSKTI